MFRVVGTELDAMGTAPRRHLAPRLMQAKTLLDMKPGLRTLFISGYSPNRSGLGRWSFLRKPFTRNELLDAVRTLIERIP